MKAIILLVIAGGILYLILGLGGDKTATPKLPRPPVIVTRQVPAVAVPPSDPSQMPAATPAVRTTVNLAEPIPEAKAYNIAVIKGAVVSVNGDQATIDCDFLPTLPEEDTTFTSQQNFSAEYLAKRRAEAQTKLNQKTFGEPLMATADGTRQKATWIPKQKTKGKVVLRGLDLGMGDIVHLLAAPATASDGAPTYTARFTVTGNVWMWSETGRTGLDSSNTSRP